MYWSRDMQYPGEYCMGEPDHRRNLPGCMSEVGPEPILPQ